MSKRKQQARDIKQRPPLDRMLRIHQSIQSGRYPNASTLATDLEVSTKTIQRDVTFMRERLDLPLEYHPQRHGFYYTENVSSFPTIQITEGEIFALVVAEKAFEQYRGTPFEKPLLSALKKIGSSLPDTISLSLSEVQQTISFRTRAEPILDLQAFDVLTKATAERAQLEISYRKPGQQAVEPRLVDPYHLANINGEWYLFAFDHLRKDLRTFVPARMKAIRRTGVTFVRPSRFSLDQQLRGSFGVHSRQGDYEVRIRFTPRVADYIREKRWHDSQKLTELLDGALELRLSLSSLIEVERWVLGWGGDAVVLSPPELVRSVAAAAARLLEGHPGPAA